MKYKNLKCRVFDIPGAVNVRDIGGYRASNGKEVASGRFIRSASLARLEPSGIDALLSLGLECVVDLRSDFECEKAPDIVERDERITYIHLSMYDYILQHSDFPETLAAMYIGLLKEAGESIRKVFELFASESYSRFLFHCTAGKDRTGLIAMLLLSLAGVDDETVIEDYGYTGILLDPATGAAKNPGVPFYLFEATPESMRAAIGWMRENFGDASGYLANIGICRQTQELILDKLFD